MADAHVESGVEDYYSSGWNPYEINARKGIPFGGMPTSLLLARMEETPGMDAGPGETPEGAYDAFARTTLTDWGPDAPAPGDEDNARGGSGGDGAHRLNYQYYGGHGEASATGPRHPELFLDFSDSDVPGDQLRWDEARRQAGRRIRVLTSAMGDNDDNHVSESPWTSVSERRDMKTLQTWVSRTRRIHGAQYLGRDPLGGVTATEADIRAARDASIGSTDAGVADPARGEGYLTMGRGRERLDGSAAAVAGAGMPDAFFGGGSYGRFRGVEKFGAHRGGEGVVSARLGGRMGTLVGAPGHIATTKGQVVAPGSAAARATAAGRNAIYGTRFRASADGVAAGSGLRAGSDGRVARAATAADLPGVAVVEASEASQAFDLGRRLRLQSAPEARRALGRSVVETYHAAGAGAETDVRRATAAPASSLRKGNMRDAVRHDRATYWHEDDRGQDLRSRAKGEALPEGGFSKLKQDGTRHGMDYRLRVRDDYGMAASRTGAGSAFGREGGGVVGRGAAPGGVVPDELDGAA